MKGIYRISQQDEEMLGRQITKFDPGMAADYKKLQHFGDQVDELMSSFTMNGSGP